MLDGTGLVLVLTLLGVAFVCALRRQYREGWHAGRVDLIREHQRQRRPRITITGPVPSRYWDNLKPRPSVFDQDAR